MRWLMVRLAAAAFGGAVTAMAYPTHNLWWTAPFGVAALVLATHRLPDRRRRRTGALLGATYAAVLHLLTISWVGVYLGWLPVVALVALMAFDGAICGVGLAQLGTRLSGWRVPALAAWWVVSEAVASRFPFGGFGWSRLAASQADGPYLGLMALGGMPVVGFAVALTGALLAAALTHPRPVRGVLLTGIAAVVAVSGLAVPKPVAAQDGTLNVLGIQGNVPKPGMEFNARRRAVLDNHVAQTEAAAEQIARGERPQPAVVVWPENASDIDPFRNPDAYAAITTAQRAIQVPMLVGGLVVRDDRQIENSSILWTADGPGERYVKRLPVPFAEYVPYRSVFQRIVPMLAMAGNMVAGDHVGLFEINGARVGDLICFEIEDDGAVRDVAQAGAQVIMLQTNNATFGHTAESYQQLALARLRAVEYGRSVMQISTVGVSGIVAPDGTVQQPTELFTPASIQAALPLRSSQTVAARLGAAPEYALVGGGIVAFTISARRSRSTRRFQGEAGPPA